MEQLKSITVSNSVAEFLHSIFDSTPMRTKEEIEMCLRCHPVTKEAIGEFKAAHKALFTEFAVLMPKGNAGKGGGKVKQHEMEHQIPQERSAEYQDRFLALANQEVELVFTAKDIKTLHDEWITPKWLLERIERFITEGGIKSITHMKVMMQCIYDLEDAKPYKKTEKKEAQGKEEPTEKKK